MDPVQFITADIRRRQIAALKRYCEYDRSDPFAFDRGIMHIARGLCGPCEASDMVWLGTKIGAEAGSDGHYDATYQGQLLTNVRRT